MAALVLPHDMPSAASATHDLSDRLQKLTLPSAPASVFVLATVVLLSIKLRLARRARKSAETSCSLSGVSDVKQPITASPWILPPAAPPAPPRYAAFRPDYSAYPYLQDQMPFTSTPTSFNYPPLPQPTIRKMDESELSFNGAN
ncbi:hypothetical protein LTS18_009681, partial [Coniosporium uncinatum]